MFLGKFFFISYCPISTVIDTYVGFWRMQVRSCYGNIWLHICITNWRGKLPKLSTRLLLFFLCVVMTLYLVHVCYVTLHICFFFSSACHFNITVLFLTYMLGTPRVFYPYYINSTIIFLIDLLGTHRVFYPCWVNIIVLFLHSVVGHMTCSCHCVRFCGTRLYGTSFFIKLS